MAGNDSISSLNLKTNEYKMKIETAKTDSTAVKKAKPKVVPVGQTEETNETQKAKQSSAPQKPQSHYPHRGLSMPDRPEQ